MITPTDTVNMATRTMTIPPRIMMAVIIMVKVATTMETALVMKPLNQNSERSSNSPLICTKENMTMKLNKS